MKQIEKDFIESWNLIENFYQGYNDDKRPFNLDALRLIKEMRNLGLDKDLRTGQSLWFLLLSRNRNHGLDKEPHLQITFLGENKMVINSNFNGEKVSKEIEVNYKGYFEDMINKLLKEKTTWNDYDIDTDPLLDLFNNE
ncbi:MULTISPECIES: hypothetical protein [Flavobacterium]|uniref:Uncharacterized protein n=1 Tax=Flavobacterium jumunjinense TaxID=998845 RepID=A0ABV5GJL8_9FLAO|nr:MULTISPECIES: hypothetical protein [Flavobacterium]